MIILHRIQDRCVPCSVKKAVPKVFKAPKTTTQSFQILHFSVEGFNGASGKTAVLDLSSTVFFDHDK